MILNNKILNTIIQESIDNFLINEGLPVWKKHGSPFSSREEIDVSNWYNIGKVDYSPYGKGDYMDIWSNPNNFHEYVLMMHKNQGQGRCCGDLNDLPYSAKSNIEIFNDFKNTEYSIPFLGEMKTEEDYQNHKIFMSKLNYVDDNKVLLQHNSDIQIQNGILKSGCPKQNYSKNNDIGWYSWATQEIGNDPSNSSRFTYYCLVNVDDIYDFQNDLDRISNLTQAVYNKPYVAMYWGDNTDVIAVTSFKSTPIYYIRDNTNGKKYNANWQEIN